jgi:hypothetical protein
MAERQDQQAPISGAEPLSLTAFAASLHHGEKRHPQDENYRKLVQLIFWLLKEG